jgi:hypothetical protein
MPTNRRHLTNSEEGAHLARVQLLRGSGVEIQAPPQATEVPAVRMIQEGDPLSSIVCDLSCGGVGFVVWMSFVAMKSHLVVADIELIPPWNEPGLSLLSDPKEERGRQKLYRLPNGPEYPRTDVLNHRIGEYHPLARGEMMTGALIAIGSTPMPGHWKHGESAKMEIAVFDQYGNRFSQSVSLWVDRSMRPDPAHLRQRRGTGLYGGSKYGPVTSPPAGKWDHYSQRRGTIAEPSSDQDWHK